MTRAGLEEALRLGAMAAFLEESAPSTTSIAWRRAGRALLELAARTRGDLFIGDKWTWAKARRSGLGEDLVEACSQMSTRRHWADATRLLGLAIPDPRGVVTVERAPAATLTLSGTTYELVDGRTLVATAPARRPRSSEEECTCGALRPLESRST